MNILKETDNRCKYEVVNRLKIVYMKSFRFKFFKIFPKIINCGRKQM